MKYSHTLEIKEYKGWLILTVLEYGVKLKSVGIGSFLSVFLFILSLNIDNA